MNMLTLLKESQSQPSYSDLFKFLGWDFRWVFPGGMLCVSLHPLGGAEHKAT
jgi:hypothetical protein